MKKRLEEVGSLPITKISWEHVFLGPKMLNFISKPGDRPAYHPLGPDHMSDLEEYPRTNSLDTTMTYFHGKISWIHKWYDFTGAFMIHALVLFISP